MIIIWGTKSRRECLGTVADWCLTCRQTQAFTVTNYFRVGHIYYIPLGRGSLVGTVKECWECGSQFEGEEEDYDAFLPEESAKQMSMSELLHQTNRYLEKRLQAAKPRTGNHDTEVWDALPADEDEGRP